MTVGRFEDGQRVRAVLLSVEESEDRWVQATEYGKTSTSGRWTVSASYSISITVASRQSAVNWQLTWWVWWWWWWWWLRLSTMMIIIIIIIITKAMFIVLSSWPQSHCESSLGSFDECRTAPSGRRPSDQATCLAVSPPATTCNHHRHLLLLLSPKAVPRRVEGWVDLSTAGRVRKAVNYDRHNCSQRSSIQGPRDFRRKSQFISETVRDRLMVTMER